MTAPVVPSSTGPLPTRAVGVVALISLGAPDGVVCTDDGCGVPDPAAQDGPAENGPQENGSTQSPDATNRSSVAAYGARSSP